MSELQHAMRCWPAVKADVLLLSACWVSTSFRVFKTLLADVWSPHNSERQAMDYATNSLLKACYRRFTCTQQLVVLVNTQNPA